MKDGFIKVAACSPKVVLADPKANADAIIAALHRAAAHGVRLAAFPELAMTGYTCGDLFMHELLLDSVETELLRIARETANLRLAADSLRGQALQLRRCHIARHRACCRSENAHAELRRIL